MPNARYILRPACIDVWRKAPIPWSGNRDTGGGAMEGQKKELLLQSGFL